ncbi:MAG: hypothetical protein ACI9XC_001601 [Gammaproteobacteria bacterium]|jgi:hypothetical protein
MIQFGVVALLLYSAMRFQELTSVPGIPCIKCLHLGISNVRETARYIDGFFRRRSERSG